MHAIVDILLRDGKIDVNIEDNFGHSVLHTPRTFYCKERSHTIYLKQLQQIPYCHQSLKYTKMQIPQRPPKVTSS